MFRITKLPRVISSACLAIATGLVLCIPASAVSLDTTLYGYGDVGNVNVHAVVTKFTESSSSYYLYSYTVSYLTGAALHTFGVVNETGTSFYDATSSLSYTTATGDPIANSALFTNPEYSLLSPYDDVQWIGSASAELKEGETRIFTYKSNNAPQDIAIYCYAADGGGGAEGETLGMSDAIPEPSSVLALALGLSGCAPFLIKRKK